MYLWSALIPVPAHWFALGKQLGISVMIITGAAGLKDGIVWLNEAIF